LFIEPKTRKRVTLIITLIITAIKTLVKLHSAAGLVGLNCEQNYDDACALKEINSFQ